MEEPLLSNSCCTCAYMESQCCYSHEYIITSEPVFLIEYLYFFTKNKQQQQQKKTDKINEVLASLPKSGKLLFFLYLLV